MEPINDKNYFEHTELLSYHSIRDFTKCEFLYAERKAGKVARIDRSYFVFGNAFDSYLTGDFSQKFIVGKDPKKTREQLVNARAKAEESRRKYEGRTDKRSQEALGKAIRMIEEIEAREMEIDDHSDKEAITDTVFGHIEASVKAMERQTLMERFPRSAETNQQIIVTEIAGKKVKGKLDYFHKGNKIIVDYKTTAQMAKFNPMMYAGQLAWYRMLAKAAFDISCDCYLAVVDKDANIKHAYFYQFADETLDAVEPELLAAVERIKEAEEVGIFEPTAFRDIRECFSCDHYGNCPFVIQKDPEII